MPIVQTGLERLIAAADSYRNRQAALVANHTSVTRDLVYGWDVLPRRGVSIKKIFSPEHGLFGTEQDQVPVGEQPGLPAGVVSLYGSTADSLVPAESHLAGIDLVLFDIQDVGARYYTYLNTMVLFMKALSGTDIEFIVLDRPNPLGGVITEGPVLRPGYESFVGVLPVTIRHGLTAGETALYARDHFKLDLNLKIMEMTGWKRDMYFTETGLPWVPPSPNMPTISTAFVYPGCCLFEGVNVSEGRGTTTPFELLGAPWIDSWAFAERANSQGLPGVIFRSHYFKPVSGKYRGVICGGVHIHITDHGTFRPFLTGVSLIHILHEMDQGFEFLEGVYEFETRHPAFDLLSGSSAIRDMIQGGEPVSRISESWDKEERTFLNEKQNYHRYGEA